MQGEKIPLVLATAGTENQARDSYRNTSLRTPGPAGACLMKQESAQVVIISYFSPDIFGVSPLASPLSPYSLSSDPSSRDSSPSRDSSLFAADPRQPVVIHSSGKKFGFTLRAIRVYACDGDIYTVYHMVWVRTALSCHIQNLYDRDEAALAFVRYNQSFRKWPA